MIASAYVSPVFKQVSNARPNNTTGASSPYAGKHLIDGDCIVCTSTYQVTIAYFIRGTEAGAFSATALLGMTRSQDGPDTCTPHRALRWTAR